jgi:hypothetical protein
MQKIKETRYLLSKWKLYEEKNHLGQPNPRDPLSKDKASYKALVLTKPITVVIPFHNNTKPIVNASQPSLLLERVFDGILYLRANP